MSRVGGRPGAHAQQGATDAVVLPDGTFTIPVDYGGAVLASTGGRLPHGTSSPPPILASVATLAADGASIETILAMAGGSIAEGPLLGECDIQVHRCLEYQTPYRVTRRFLSLRRKPSTRLGEMDVFVFLASLVHPTGDVVADVTYTWILPKGHRG